MKKIGMLLAAQSGGTQTWTEDDVSYTFVETVQIEGAEHPVVSTGILLKAHIANIASAPGNAYTIWAHYTDKNEQARWENIYAQTQAEKISTREFFHRKGVRAHALLIIPAVGMEPVLVFESESQEALDSVASEFITQAQLGSLIASTVPTVSLASVEGADGMITITATASADITGTELRWEATAGYIDSARSTFSGNTASVIAKRPLSGGAMRVKCGFKFYSGIAEISI